MTPIYSIFGSAAALFLVLAVFLAWDRHVKRILDDRDDGMDLFDQRDESERDPAAWLDLLREGEERRRS